MTGWASVYGQYVVDGAKLFFKEHNNKFKDRPIKFYIEDTQGQTELTIEKFDVLKNRDKVHVIIGPSLGNEGEAASDWANRNQDMPILIGYSAPEDLTMRNQTKNLIRPGWTGAHDTFYYSWTGLFLSVGSKCGIYKRLYRKWRRRNIPNMAPSGIT